MGEVDWNAIAGELGQPPPRPLTTPPPDTVQGLDPEIQRRIQELNDILPPGAKFTLNLPSAGNQLPQSQVRPAAPAAVASPTPGAAAAPAGPVDWNAIAGELGMPPPRPLQAPAPPAPQIPDLMPPQTLTAGLERLKLPERFTLAGTPSPAGTPSQEAARAAAEASGQPVMTATTAQPSFPHRVAGALHDYFTAKFRADATPGNEADLENAKARLRDEVMQIARAGGTTWNGLVGMAQSVPEFGDALKDSTMGLMGAVSASAAGAAGVPGATPDVVKAELERSRAGTEKAGEIGMGFLRAPVDPWFYAATAAAKKVGLPASEEEAGKFRQMLEADPIMTAAMMAGAPFAVRGSLRRIPELAEKLGATWDTPPPPPEVKTVKAEPVVPRGIKEGLKAVDEAAARAVPPPSVERRAQPAPGPRENFEDLVSRAEQADGPKAMRAAYKDARRAVFGYVQDLMNKAGTEDPSLVTSTSPHLTNLLDRMRVIEDRITAAETPSKEAPPPKSDAQEGPRPLMTKRNASGGPVFVSDLSDKQLGVLAENLSNKIDTQRRHIKGGGAVIGGGHTLEHDFDLVTAEQNRRSAVQNAKPSTEAAPAVETPESPGATTPTTRAQPAPPTEHAIGESLRYGKQRVVVREVLKDTEGNVQGYRVKGKHDRTPFVIKPEAAKPWGEIVSKKVPGRAKVGELTHEDLSNSEVVARFLQENGGLRESGETRDLGRFYREKGLMGVVRKGGLEVDDMAERLAGSGVFRDKDHAAEWLNDWIYEGGVDKMGTQEGDFVGRAQSQAGRFGVPVSERRARLAHIGRDLNRLVLNPKEGQKGSLKIGDVVMAQDDVYRVKRDTQNPGKLILKDGRTIRLKEGETIEGVKMGRMPVRTREELKAAGSPVDRERLPHVIEEAVKPAGEVPFGEEAPDPYEHLKGRMRDLVEQEAMVPKPTGEKPNPVAVKLYQHLADERRAIELELDKIREAEGGEAEAAVRDAAGWPERNEDVLAEARRKTDEAAARTKRIAEAEKKRKKDIEAKQGSIFDKEVNDIIEGNADAAEAEAEFNRTQPKLLGYPNPQEGVTRAAARPVPMEKNLKPKRREAVVRAQDIKRRLEKAVLAPIRYGVGRKKARGFFNTFARIIRTKKYLDLPVDFHEAGHALQQILWPEINQISGKKGFNVKGPNSKAMRAELKKLGEALYGKRKPEGGYKSEGLAEFTRLYIEDRAKAKAEAPVFFEEFKRRLLQDADTIDIGRVLDESQAAYEQFNKQPAVAKALSRIDIGGGTPIRWSLDRISSALFNNQAFIRGWTRTLNGGVVPPEGLGNPVTHAKMLRGWTGLPEAALMRHGGVADFRTSAAFEKRGESVGDIVAPVADKPLPFISEAVRAYEKMTPAERVVRRMTNVWQDANNMRGLDTLRAYWYARRTLSIAEGDVARAYATKAKVSDAVALKYVQQRGIKKGDVYRDTGLSYAEAVQVIKDLETPELKTAVEKLTQYANNVLRWYVDEGMWTEEQYNRVIKHPANQVYMPLDRYLSEYGDRGGAGFQGRSISGARPDVKRLKGSDIPLIDPFETTISNTYHIAQTVQRNRAMRAIVEFATQRPGSGWAAELVPRPVSATKFRLDELKPQIDALIKKGGGDPSLLEAEDYATWARIFRPAMSVRGGRNIATYFSKGKELMVEMDSEIYRAVAGLDQEALNSYLKVFGAPARWVRAGATLTPEFLLRNALRDPVTASILSESGGINPFTGAVPIATTARGIKEMVKNGDMAFRYRAAGAAHAAVVSMDRNYLRGQARQLLTDDKTLRKIAGVVHHPIEILRAVGELGETGTRLGVFARELDASGITHSNILKAAVKSREATTDFNVYGTVLEPFARTVPFLNPGIQSVLQFNRVTGRAIADIAKSVAALGHGEFRTPEAGARYASRVLTYVVAPSVALHIIRQVAGRQDDYLELPAWRRHLFWNLPLPKEMAKTYGFNWLSVPKPFEIGVLYGSGTELMLEWMDKHDPKALDEYRDSLIGAFTPNVMPAFLNASVENLANRKIAFDRPIMPESQKALEPQLQYGLYTSETAKLGAAGIRKLPSLVGKPVSFVIKLTGEQEGVNPYDVDNVIRSLTAGLGQYYVTPALDFVVRRLVGGTKEGERLGIGTSATTKMRASDVPTLRGVIPRASEIGGGLIERTYTDIAASEKAWNTYVALDGWQKDEYLQDLEKRQLIVGHHVLSDVRDGLSNVNRLVQQARKDGDEELVDHLREMAVDMARNAPKRIKEAMDDPAALNAIAIERDLSRMRSEARARYAELATVLEAAVEGKESDADIRADLDKLDPEDRRWAVRYLRGLRDAAKLNAEREALKGASRREKLHLKERGMLH